MKYFGRKSVIAVREGSFVRWYISGERVGKEEAMRGFEDTTAVVGFSPDNIGGNCLVEIFKEGVGVGEAEWIREYAVGGRVPFPTVGDRLFPSGWKGFVASCRQNSESEVFSAVCHVVSDGQIDGGSSKRLTGGDPSLRTSAFCSKKKFGQKNGVDGNTVILIGEPTSPRHSVDGSPSTTKIAGFATVVSWGDAVEITTEIATSETVAIEALASRLSEIRFSTNTVFSDKTKFRRLLAGRAALHNIPLNAEICLPAGRDWMFSPSLTPFLIAPMPLPEVALTARILSIAQQTLSPHAPSEFRLPF